MALVFAMAGGALAANGVIITKLNQIKPSVQKQLKGAAGPQGAKGDAGAPGTAGPVGAKGDVGSAGAPGESVKTGATGPSECEGEGGTKFTVGGKTETVCNGAEGTPGLEGPPGDEGKEGKEGKEGSPWVAGQAPSNVLLKGTWTIPPYVAAAAEELLYTPISTGVPVPVGDDGYVAVAGPEGTICPGTAENPLSPNPGTICVYPALLTNLEAFIPAPSKAFKSGGGLVAAFETLGAGLAQGYGSWALRTR